MGWYCRNNNTLVGITCIVPQDVRGCWITVMLCCNLFFSKHFQQYRMLICERITSKINNRTHLPIYIMIHQATAKMKLRQSWNSPIRFFVSYTHTALAGINNNAISKRRIRTTWSRYRIAHLDSEEGIPSSEILFIGSSKGKKVLPIKFKNVSECWCNNHMNQG